VRGTKPIKRTHEPARGKKWKNEKLPSGQCVCHEPGGQIRIKKKRGEECTENFINTKNSGGKERGITNSKEKLKKLCGIQHCWAKSFNIGTKARTQCGEFGRENNRGTKIQKKREKKKREGRSERRKN